jgi:hypothetical protein
VCVLMRSEDCLDTCGVQMCSIESVYKYGVCIILCYVFIAEYLNMFM